MHVWCTSILFNCYWYTFFYNYYFGIWLINFHSEFLVSRDYVTRIGVYLNDLYRVCNIAQYNLFVLYISTYIIINLLALLLLI